MVLASKQTSEAALGCQTASTSQHWLMVSCFQMECNVRLMVLGHMSVRDLLRTISPVLLGQGALLDSQQRTRQ
jgi:hypothetical protein